MAKRRQKKRTGIHPGISPNHTRKISEILLEIVEGLESLDSPHDVLEEAAALAALVWNLPMMPPTMRNQLLDGLHERLSQGAGLELQARFHELLAARQEHYADDRRFIVNYRLKKTTDGPYLEVASVDLDRPENHDFLDRLETNLRDKI